jgi:hypothetical protein
MPDRLSVTSSVRLGGTQRSATATTLGLAWRTPLLIASCAMRKSSCSTRAGSLCSGTGSARNSQRKRPARLERSTNACSAATNPVSGALLARNRNRERRVKSLKPQSRCEPVPARAHSAALGRSMYGKMRPPLHGRDPENDLAAIETFWEESTPGRPSPAGALHQELAEPPLRR